MKKKMLFERAKRLGFALVMLLCATATHAVPAKPGQKRQLTLTDGTTVSAVLVGDEHGHFWMADNGNAYQAVAGTEVFQPIDKQAVVAKAKQRRAKANGTRAKRLPRKSTWGVFGDYTGEKKGLIILVNFNDKEFGDSHDNALFQRIANEKGLSYGNFKGSMYDYFYDQSCHQFELTFDIVGPITVTEKSSYYGANNRDGYDMHCGEMVIEALTLVDDEVDFTKYDWNGDGEVEQVYLVYAGKGEADGGAVNTIWPHAYTLQECMDDLNDGDGPKIHDGVVIDTYACGSELDGSNRICGIGTMCHEFSHCLGYPDFYDIDYSGGQGMFTWDLMDSGCYNDNGYTPAGYTGYERWMAGWQQPIELTTTMQVDNMLSLQDGGDFYVIYNKGHRDEYFMLENRQLNAWDAALPGNGLLIVHVDYDADVWFANTPNDVPNRQRMTWIAADNNYQYTMYMGTKYYTEIGAKNDPFPYGNVNAFNKNTTPVARFNNKNSDGTYFLDSSVENITRNADGTISFLFNEASGEGDIVDNGSYTLVTNTSDLTDGDALLLAYVTEKEAYVMGTTQNTNNRSATDHVTLKADGTLTPGDDAELITLEQSGDNYLLRVTDGYLYAASSSSNWLRTEETPDDNALAAITIDDNGDATIVFQGSNTRNHLRFNLNNGKPIFSSYAETSTVRSLPQLYRLNDVTTAIVSVSSKPSNGKALYDLQGRRVNRPSKGIYIIGGKKHVVR